MVIETDNTADVSTDVDFLGEGETPETQALPPVTDLPETSEGEEIPPPEEEVEEAPEEAAPEGTDSDEILPHQRPTVAAIKEKYPELFKDFPALRASMFRERAFSEVFPTVNDAKQASENNEVFVSMRDDILNGGGEKLLEGLKESNSLGKFSQNFLPKLFKADREAHWQVIAPVLEDAAKAFYQQGVRSKDDNVKHAAEHLALFLFGDAGFATGTKTGAAGTPKTSEVKESDTEKERKEWAAEQLQTFTSSVKEDSYTNLKSIASIGLPKDGITKWQRDKLMDDIVTKVDQAMTKDPAHMKFMQGLWKKAREAGFNTDSKTRIINAYLARAKSLAPGIRRALITEALGNISTRAEEVTEQVTSRRTPSSSGTPARASSGKVNAKQVDWSRTSDADFLNDNVTLKRQ